MANITYIKCTNPCCGKKFELKCDPAQAICKAFKCFACETLIQIKDAMYDPSVLEQPAASPVDRSAEQPKEKVNPEPKVPEKQDNMFYNRVILFRETDGYPYLFFSSRTTFGRYDETMQADVLCMTDDTTMSRRHVAINLSQCDKGSNVSLTNLCNGRTKVGSIDLAMGETIDLSDGMNIRLGNTDFTIRDINQNDI